MAAAFQLPPAPREMAVFDNLIARQTETLILREKVMSLTGDSFEIKLASGQPILKVQGKVMSISGRKSIFDMAGTHLFDIVKEHLHIHTTFAIETPTGQKIMEVKSGFKLLGSKATATFTSSKGTAETLTMKGNWVDYSAEIHDQASNALVARIDRKVLSGRDLLFGQQTYALTVAPNMDMALMAALCICMDEKNNEK
ncbi:tubby C-terminal-like domain-containing protein [Ilyonectria robusta]|uniref:tubby C-terminal-like domain-containing protein n=1 Tax=Ilyonectria robusta TaxID=1079257 RepID=UPI001E8E0768|nr:tubby C-terminal-like domain-containing protein [Ilyonectria robusta]KAH6980950.1 tubby C-terminal-like domain-containing protein [Ilyonectria sp. MPI-CAGE-AT-0026]KAH8721894.1 tubby C-terminal-like domain-containing protein [Ilyonectria robusta]